MADTATTVEDLKALYRQFVAERAWEPFHGPKNLVMGLAIEAAELMEHYLWVESPDAAAVCADPVKRAAVADEMADVAGYLLSLSNVMGIDLSDAIRAKMVKNIQKYPADQYRGKYEL